MWTRVGTPQQMSATAHGRKEHGPSQQPNGVAVRLPWHCLAVERHSVLEGKKRTPSGHLRNATICFPKHSLAATQFVTFQPPAGASRCLPRTEHHSSAACRSQHRLASGAGVPVGVALRGSPGGAHQGQPG